MARPRRQVELTYAHASGLSAPIVSLELREVARQHLTRLPRTRKPQARESDRSNAAAAARTRASSPGGAAS